MLRLAVFCYFFLENPWERLCTGISLEQLLFCFEVINSFHQGLSAIFFCPYFFLSIYTPEPENQPLEKEIPIILGFHVKLQGGICLLLSKYHDFSDLFVYRQVASSWTQGFSTKSWQTNDRGAMVRYQGDTLGNFHISSIASLTGDSFSHNHGFSGKWRTIWKVTIYYWRYTHSLTEPWLWEESVSYGETFFFWACPVFSLQ